MIDEIKKKILSANKIEKVSIEGIDLCVRHMTGAERDKFLIDASKAQESKNYYGLDRLLVSLTVCDQDGKLVFSGPDELKDVDSTLITKLSDKASALNVLSKESREKEAKN